MRTVEERKRIQIQRIGVNHLLCIFQFFRQPLRHVGQGGDRFARLIQRLVIIEIPLHDIVTICAEEQIDVEERNVLQKRHDLLLDQRKGRCQQDNRSILFIYIGYRCFGQIDLRQQRDLRREQLFLRYYTIMGTHHNKTTETFERIDRLSLRRQNR